MESGERTTPCRVCGAPQPVNALGFPTTMTCPNCRCWSSRGVHPLVILLLVGLAVLFGLLA